MACLPHSLFCWGLLGQQGSSAVPFLTAFVSLRLLATMMGVCSETAYAEEKRMAGVRYGKRAGSR
jgi:hypothetical protein